MNLEKRLLVYLGSRGGVAMLSGRLGPKWKVELSASKDGIRHFSDLLGKHRRVPVTLLVDSVDEEYRPENLPHVMGRSRQELLSRKLRQVFRNAPYSAAILQGRHKEGRRDDRYLLVSLTDNDWLQPWIDTIRGHDIPFAGMTLLSVAAENLLTRLKIRDPYVLLASRQSAGLRLTYFLQGKLRFSRLIRSDSHESANLNVAEEISKTQLYLTSQRLLPREGRLTVCLLDYANKLSSAQAALNADPQFDARLIQPGETGRRLGIPPKFLDVSPEVLYLAALAKKFPNLAPEAFSTGYQLLRIKWGFLAAGGTALVASTAMAGWSWLQARSDTVQMQQLHASIRQHESQYQQTLRQLPQIPLSADSLSSVVETFRQIEKGKRTPLQAYAHLSRVLDQNPAIALDRLGWQAPAFNQIAGNLADSIELDARILPFNGNYRVAMDQIRHFMTDLRTSSGVRDVKLLSEPVNTASSSTLSGTTLESAQLPEARFKLSLKIDINQP